MNKFTNFPEASVWQVTKTSYASRNTCDNQTRQCPFIHTHQGKLEAGMTVGEVYLNGNILSGTRIVDTSPRRENGSSVGALKAICLRCAGCSIALERL